MHENMLDCLLTLFAVAMLDWPRRAGSSSLGRVPGPPRPDSGQDFGTEYSSRVRILVSSIRAESRCWYRVLTRIPDPARQDIIYYY